MAKKLVVLINLGSPKSLVIKDIRSYLAEFLMDKRVIDLPFLLRWLLVYLIILPFRAKRTQKKYMKIWRQGLSPLIALSSQLASALQLICKYPVILRMRYAEADKKQILSRCLAEHPECEEICIFPLYPHYAMSSYETAVAYLKDEIRILKTPIKVSVIEPFYNHSAYLNAIAKTYQHIAWNDYDRIIFSYHGIPLRHLKKTDPHHHCLTSEDCCQNRTSSSKICYKYQCEESTRLIAEKLGIDTVRIIHAYQSRLGNDQWLAPNTADVIDELAKSGQDRILILSPSFVVDCLETLEEIQMDLKHRYLKSTVAEFRYLPCLNLNQHWVEAMNQIIMEKLNELPHH